MCILGNRSRNLKAIEMATFIKDLERATDPVDVRISGRENFILSPLPVFVSPCHLQHLSSILYDSSLVSYKTVTRPVGNIIRTQNPISISTPSENLRYFSKGNNYRAISMDSQDDFSTVCLNGHGHRTYPFY